MGDVIDFVPAGTGTIARRLTEIADELGTTIRRALEDQLRTLQSYNLLELTPEDCVKAVDAMRRVKALIAETYPDVHRRLVEMAAASGRLMTDKDAARVCRELHPECFEVKLQ